MQKALKIIDEVKRGKHLVLSLHGFHLKYIPEEIRELTQIKQLFLSNNDIVSIPKWLSELKHLQVLNLSTNQLSHLPEELQQLDSLLELGLSNNLLAKIPDWIGSLKKLKALYLHSNQIEELAAPMRFCQELNMLDLRGNKLKEVPDWIGDFCHLTSLDISDNSLERLSDGLGRLNKLRSLDLSSNQLNHLPNIIGSRATLQSIDIRDNQFKELPAWLFTLENIKIVDLFSDETWDNRLFLKNNPIESPPLEVLVNGKEAAFEYFQSKDRQGESSLYEAKIVVVGAGGAGKTTLVRKLQNLAHQVPSEVDKHTQGIVVCQHIFDLIVKGEKEKLTAHVWDFGGQEIYHATHQFFLSEDTLYLLLNDNRQHDTDFYYWLNIIHLRAGSKCPILLVFNAKEGIQRQIVLESELFFSFPALQRELLEVNFADSNFYNIQKTVDFIRKKFAELEVMGRKLPSFWVKVRNDLKKITADYITHTEFVDICKKNGITEVSEISIVGKTLHNLGIILHFSDILSLDDLVILNPNWCTDAVYKILDAVEIQKGRGKFSEKELVRLWSDRRYSGKKMELLQLMTKFDLCYRIENTDSFIAPQLLPIEEPAHPKFPHEELLRFSYQYQFMPKGIVSSFIARMSHCIEGHHVWRGGVRLRWRETVAEVIQNQFNGQINIKLHGVDKKSRLLDIQRVFNSIHALFNGLKVTEKIPCNCPRCMLSEAPTLFEVEYLKVLEKAPNAMAQCVKNGELQLVPPKQLLDGVFDPIPRIAHECRKLLEDGMIEQALKRAMACEELSEEVVLLSNRHKQLERKVRQGIVSFEQEGLERRRIVAALISLLH